VTQDTRVRLEHICIGDRDSLPASEAHLRDRQKLAVVLQTASFASLLDAASHQLDGSWLDLRIDEKGRVCGLSPRAEPTSRPHQSWLIRLLDLLFEADDTIPGRGRVRTIARRLYRLWAGYPAALPADRAVFDLLDQAPYLWSRPYDEARKALAGSIEGPDGEQLWLAGTGSFRRLVLKRVESLERLAGLVESEESRSLWTRAHEVARKPQCSESRSSSCVERALESLHPKAFSLQDYRPLRRALSRAQAAELWSAIAQQRVESLDLAGVDRAIGHALVLQPNSTPCSLWHERQRLSISMRIRRGRFAGLPQTLSQLESCARRDLPGPIQSQVVLLRARFELSRGMPAMALGILAAHENSSKRADRELARESMVLKARALGWLGRSEECREIVDQFSTEDWKYLEPEEKPALVSLAGDHRGASEAARDRCWKQLWQALSEPSPGWTHSCDPFESLEEFRASRLVLDIELARPGSSPERWVRQAETCFRALGAAAFAARLDRARRASWRVLTDYLDSSSSGGEIAVRRLLEDAGYFDARLIWRHGSHRKVLIPGAGGPEELSACFGRGELLLRADRLDAPLRALFAFVAREYRPTAVKTARDHRAREWVGESDELLCCIARLERLARRDLSVLIRGETGTGKELAARQVHRLSNRSTQPFVAVNCAALSESLLLSELFGHARGAFTGADRSRAGIFESAAGGTVFLDEIGDLPLVAQAKLLRVLQEGEIRRLGESRPRGVDVRVVAATHRDLESMMKSGEFRSDVYYRLAAGIVELPPLRHRGGDALALAEHFLSQQGYSMSAAAGQRLLGYSWPGNVRELKNVIELAMALCDDRIVHVNHLELPQETGNNMIGYHRQVEDFRRNLVREALRASDGRKAEAARRLNVSRQALSYLARTLGVE